VKILAVSDVELDYLYSPAIKTKHHDANMIISCGDLPYDYLEYMITMLNVPMYYVHGNHANQVQMTSHGPKKTPEGGINIHRRIVQQDGQLIAGVEGCLQYNYGPYQYSQADMWWHVFSLVPGMLINKMYKGRYLDIFVTHAPPWHIHDQPDRPHQGIKAFVWFDRVFQPKYHLHGHTHVYRHDTVIKTNLEKTIIQNVYSKCVIHC
jgi:uncharacterized protein